MYKENCGHQTSCKKTSIGGKMEESLKEVSGQSNGILTFIVVMGLLAAAVLVYKSLKKKKSVDSDRTSNSDECVVSEAMVSWFEKTLQAYAKIYCAYLLEQSRLKNNLSMDEVKSLRDKYGVERISPDLFLEMKFAESFPGADMDALKAMQKAWLDEKHISYHENSMSEAIAREIERNVTPEFQNEFENFVKSMKKN